MIPPGITWEATGILGILHSPSEPQEMLHGMPQGRVVHGGGNQTHNQQEMSAFTSLRFKHK